MSTKAHAGKRELRWAVAGSLLIVCIEAKAINDTLWGEWLAAIEGSQAQSMMLCVTGAMKPTTAQWRNATKVMKERGMAVAVVSDERHNAALAKKAAWLGANVKSFRWDASLYDPLMYLEFDLQARRELKPQILALRDYYDGGAKAQPAPRTPARAASAQVRQMPAWMREEAPAKQERERPAAPRRRAAAKPQVVEKGSTTDRGKLSADAQRSRDAVFRSSEDIQAKLAEVQARLRARNLEMRRARG